MKRYPLSTESTANSFSAISKMDSDNLMHPNGAIAFNKEEPAILIVSASGMILKDNHGLEYIDAISGLINVNVGYGRHELNAAATQAKNISYGTLFFGRTNEFAAKLAGKLATISPTGIERFFFTLSGSDANDTAFRLVRATNVARGLTKKLKILARRNSYHGATIATMSAGGNSLRHLGLGIRMPGFVDISQPIAEFDAIAELEKVIAREGPETIAAFIGEPIAYQAGMIVPPKHYWQKVREICTKNDITLIIDEVLTGFGRTGKMFAIEHWGITPDMLIISKGLTSGYLPLAAVGIHSTYHDSILASLGSGEGILGFTGTGHPASCAVALANLEIIEREGLVENSRVMGEYLLTQLNAMQANSKNISGSRVLGLLAGLDVVASHNAEESENFSFCKDIVELLKARRIFLRPFGRTIAIAPPLIATAADIDLICAEIDRAIRDVKKAKVNS